MYLSKCNVYKNIDNKLAIYNSINGNIDYFDSEAKEVVQAIIDNNEISTYGKYFQYMMKRGYAFNCQDDEKKAIKEMYHKVISNDKRLLMVIYVTQQCNFRCTYCCEEHLDVTLSLESQSDILAFLDKVLHRYNLLQLEWFGGEPLLEIDLIEKMSKRIKELCKKNNTSYIATITTNAYFLDSKVMQRTLDCNIFNYQITIDGVEEVHNKQRVLRDGSGSWQVIINNLKDIRDNIKSRMFRIMIRTNISYNLVNCKDEYIKLLSKEFGEDNRFHFLWKLVSDWGNIEDDNKNIICGFDEYKSIVKLANDAKLKTVMEHKFLYPDMRICPTSVKNALVVFADGRVGKCTRDVFPEKNTLSTIHELIKSPEVVLDVDMKKIYKSNCSRCENYYLCLGFSCPMEDTQCHVDNLRAVEFAMESIYATDPKCKIVSQL